MARIEWRNPVYNQYGTIDLEINHPFYGWIPFTATPDDPDKLGRDIYASVIGSSEDVGEYVPPVEEPPKVPTDDPVMLVLLDQINAVRDNADLPPVSVEDLKTAIEEKKNDLENSQSVGPAPDTGEPEVASS